MSMHDPMINTPFVADESTPEVERPVFTALREAEQALETLDKCWTALRERLAPVCVANDNARTIEARDSQSVPLADRIDSLTAHLNSLAGEIESTERHRLAI